MNRAQENTEIVVKGFFKSLLGSFPVGNVAVAILDELQSKQVQRKKRGLKSFTILWMRRLVLLKIR